MRMLLLIIASVWLSLGLAQTSAQEKERPLQINATAQPSTLEAGQFFEVKLAVSLPPGYKAYLDKFQLEITQPFNYIVPKLDISPTSEFFDPVTKKNKIGISDTAEIKAGLEIPLNTIVGSQQLKMKLTYQACTKTYCLFPITEEVQIPIEVIANPKSETKSLWQMKFADVTKMGLFWTFIFVFIAGVLTSFTPCVFPMIPITIAVLGRNAHLHSKKRQWLLSHLYVLGIALTYSALGVFAAATGAMFGSFMSHPVVLSVICLVFLAMAISLFGAYELQAPAWIRNKFAGDVGTSGYKSALASGIIAGVVASPCVGPVLVGILTYIAQTQNHWFGFWLMFVFALGMGQIFLLIGISSQFTKFLPKSGEWMDSIKNIFGLMLLGACYYYLSLLVPIRIWDIALGIGFILFASLKGAFTPAKTNLQRMWKGFCWVFLAFGLFYLIMGMFDLRSQLLQRTIKTESTFSLDASQWKPYTEQEFQAALKSNKPLMIDFYADWCAACKELEQYTFTSQRFQLLATQFNLIRYDATKSTPELDELKKKYNIVGLPTILFFNRKGEWLPDVTVNEFLETPKFIEHMEKALK